MVIFDEGVTICGEDKRHIEALGGDGIVDALLEAFFGVFCLRLGLDIGQGDGLCVRADFYPQRVIDPALCLPTRLALDEVNTAGCLLPADVLFRPLCSIEFRIDQFCPCVRLSIRLAAFECPGGVRVGWHQLIEDTRENKVGESRVQLKMKAG